MPIPRLKKSLNSRIRRFASRPSWPTWPRRWIQRHLDTGKQINLPLRHALKALEQPQSKRTLTMNHELSAARSALATMQETIRWAERDSTSLDVPKNLWIFWDQGFTQAPDVVRLGLRSWQIMNPDYTITCLDADSAQEFADFNSIFKLLSIDIGPAHRSDFIRTYLLARYGGVWVDSTTFCWKALNDWLSAYTRNSGFFVFSQPETRRDRQIKNWFIACSPGNPIICSLFEKLVSYNFKKRSTTLAVVSPKKYRDIEFPGPCSTGHELLEKLESRGEAPYFYFHYLFNEAVRNGKAASLWQAHVKETACHVSSQGDIDNVYISKQSYRGKYPTSPTYLERKSRLIELLDSKK